METFPRFDPGLSVAAAAAAATGAASILRARARAERADRDGTTPKGGGWVGGVGGGRKFGDGGRN